VPSTFLLSRAECVPVAKDASRKANHEHGALTHKRKHYRDDFQVLAAIHPNGVGRGFWIFLRPCTMPLYAMPRASQKIQARHKKLVLISSDHRALPKTHMSTLAFTLTVVEILNAIDQIKLLSKAHLFRHEPSHVRMKYKSASPQMVSLDSLASSIPLKRQCSMHQSATRRNSQRNTVTLMAPSAAAFQAQSGTGVIHNSISCFVMVKP